MEDNFIIICKNCGSHNVSISSYDMGYISLKCNNYGSLCECGYYNEGGDSSSLEEWND